MSGKKATILTDVMLCVSMAALALWNVAYPQWNSMALSDPSWHIPGIYAVLSAWGLPLLVAGVGRRYLCETPAYSTGFVLKKRLPRAVISCAVWWLMLTLVMMKYEHPDEPDTDTFFESMAKVLDVPYYVGFLQLTVVLFAFYPLLRRIAADRKLTAYAVAVFAVMSVVVPTLRYIPYLNYVHRFAVQINWDFFTEFGLYLFLGIFLAEKRFEWHHRVVIYCAGLLSTVAMYSCAVWLYTPKGGMDATFCGTASPFTVLQVTAVIVLLKTVSEKVKNARIWEKLSRCAYAFVPVCAISLGVFRTVIPTGVLPAAAMIPLTACAVLLCAAAFCAVIRRVPLLSYISI